MVISSNRIILFFILISLLFMSMRAEQQDLKCYSVEGNVDHYYHFFYNCLVPVLAFHEKNPDKQLRLCSSHIGSMNAIFKEILPNMTFSRECDDDVIMMKGYDSDAGKGVKSITAATRYAVMRHFLNMTEGPEFVVNQTKILLIGRGKPNHDPHRNLMIIGATSGAERRAIKNFEELDRALRNVFDSVETVFLEGLSIRKQFALFRSAKVIVAQHGAALSNLFFAGNFTKGVVEISPYSRSHRIGRHTHAYPDCFKYICERVGLKYIKVEQNGEFSEVNIENVLTSATRLLHYQ